MKLIDVSICLSPQTPVWPDAPRFEFVQQKTAVCRKEEKTDSRFSMIPHCGTHIDAPLHFDSGGLPVDAIDMDILNGRCRVVEHTGEGHITKNALDSMNFLPERRVLIKTVNSSQLRQGKLGSDYVSFLPEAIDHIIECGVKVLGIDGFSIGPFGSISDRNHVVFCKSGGIIIEMLDLSQVEPGIYTLLAFPLKIEKFEAAPARVVLVRPNDLEIFSK